MQSHDLTFLLTYHVNVRLEIDASLVDCCRHDFAQAVCTRQVIIFRNQSASPTRYIVDLMRARAGIQFYMLPIIYLSFHSARNQARSDPSETWILHSLVITQPQRTGAHLNESSQEVGVIHVSQIFEQSPLFCLLSEPVCRHFTNGVHR